jgi:hypothetical protein
VMDPNKSSDEVAPNSYSEELLGRDETCPLCRKDNQCRVAKGHLDKGLCWCDQIVVPGHILNRLAAEWVEPASICRSCLETVARVSASLNDPDAVLTEVFRLTRPSGSMLLPEDYYWRLAFDQFLVHPDRNLRTAALLRVVTKGLTSPGSHDHRIGKP